MVGARPRSVPSQASESLLVKIKLREQFVDKMDDVHPGLSAHRAQNIRDISQRKLAARSCTLRQALLIQNALPHLDAEEALADGRDAAVGQTLEYSDAEERADALPIVRDDKDEDGDPFDCGIQELQGFPLSCEDLLDDDDEDSDGSDDGRQLSDLDAEDDAVFNEDVTVDIEVVDKDYSLERRSIIRNTVCGENDRESKRLSRKRAYGGDHGDDSLKCGKPGRSASPCRLTQRHVINARQDLNVLPTLIQC